MEKTQIALAPLTSLKLGGHARHFFAVTNRDELSQALRRAQELSVDPLIVGSLTNVLLPDEDLPCVITLQADPTPVNFSQDRLTVWAGNSLSALAKQTIQAGRAGLAWFASLPGTLGGAVWNNAHFASHYLADVLERVAFYDLVAKRYRTLPRHHLDFAYDHSYFQTHPSVITEITFHLPEKTSPLTLQAQAQDALAWRQKNQPLPARSAGCFWQNPLNTPALQKRFPQFRHQERLSAGFLIDQAGLKGHLLGGAQISTQHAAFIINTGTATSQDVRALAALIQKTLAKKFDLHLTPEVLIVPPPTSS